MKAVVQRVKQSHVAIHNRVVAEIDKGLLVLLGIQEGDTREDVNFLVEKIIHLRIFEDDKGKMNISLKDVKGQLLVVSQFTLLGDCRKGRRPSFVKAAPPETARPLYQDFIDRAIALGIDTKSGVFKAEMDISLVNHGPVTLLFDTHRK